MVSNLFKGSLVMLALSGLAGCTQDQDNIKVRHREIPAKTSIDNMVSDVIKNPFLDKEAYEIDIEKDRENIVFLENSSACSTPLMEFKYNADKVYVLRIDSDNGFKKPLHVSKDYMGRYSFEVGDYELWIKNKDKPMDEIHISKERRKEFEEGRLMIYPRNPLNDNPPVLNQEILPPVPKAHKELKKNSYKEDNYRLASQ
jgi:hypothetical protein